MSPVEFEAIISAGERPQTYALVRAATGTGFDYSTLYKIIRVLIRITAFWDVTQCSFLPGTLTHQLV